MRRPGSGISRRGGLRSGSGGVPWTNPSDEPLAALWWDTTVPSGAVASWADSINAVTLVQGTAASRLTQSDTAFGTLPDKPGVTSDGADSATCTPTPIVGATALTWTWPMRDATTTFGIALEHTADAGSNNGGFAIFVNSPSAGRISGICRGTGGYSHVSCAADLTTASVVSVGFNFAGVGAAGIPFIRINGVAQALTTTTGTNAAGSIANATLAFCIRPGVGNGWPGTFGDAVARLSVAQDAGLARIERYVGTKAGISW